MFTSYQDSSPLWTSGYCHLKLSSDVLPFSRATENWAKRRHGIFLALFFLYSSPLTDAQDLALSLLCFLQSHKKMFEICEQSPVASVELGTSPRAYCHTVVDGSCCQEQWEGSDTKPDTLLPPKMPWWCWGSSMHVLPQWLMPPRNSILVIVEVSLPTWGCWLVLTVNVTHLEKLGKGILMRNFLDQVVW